MDTMTEILNTYEIDNNIDTGTEDSYEKNTRRAVRRKRNAAKALRKRRSHLFSMAEVTSITAICISTAKTKFIAPAGCALSTTPKAAGKASHTLI